MSNRAQHPLYNQPIDPALLVDGEGRSLHGLCGHCGITVDNHDANHRVSAILRGGRGVECVLRGDIAAHHAAPLGARQIGAI